MDSEFCSRLSQLERRAVVSVEVHLVKDLGTSVYEHWKARPHVCSFLMVFKTFSKGL